MKKCKQCGSRERYSNGRCAPCSRAKTQRWRAANGDLVRARAKESRLRNKERDYAATKRWRAKNSDRVKAKQKAWVLAHPENIMLINAKGRAKKQGVPCTITVADIIIPKKCPILGIPLRRATCPADRDNSPSLDRIVPSKGYVPGNVVVISYKANRFKSDATPEELMKVAEYMNRKKCSIK